MANDMDSTVDAFLDGRLQLTQPRKGYRAGLDAVFLAASVPQDRPRQPHVLDLGAGVGAAGLCFAARCEQATVVLLERAQELVEMANENVARNALSERVKVVAADVIASSAEDLTAARVCPDSFDHVIANPPYHAIHAGTAAHTPLKANAHAMEEGQLDSWCRFMARMTKPGGTATLVHRAEALAEILASLDRRFGDVRVLPLQAHAGEPAIRVLVRAIKGSRGPMTLLPSAVLHDGDGAPSAGAQRILKHGGQIDFESWSGFEMNVKTLPHGGSNPSRSDA